MNIYLSIYNSGKRSADPSGRACRPPRLSTYLPFFFPSSFLPFFFSYFLPNLLPPGGGYPPTQGVTGGRGCALSSGASERFDLDLNIFNGSSETPWLHRNATRAFSYLACKFTQPKSVAGQKGPKLAWPPKALPRPLGPLGPWPEGPATLLG